MLDKAIRELDRERMGLQNQDKKLIAEIKKMAKANQMVRPGLRRGPRTVPCRRGSVAVLACPRQPLCRTLQRQADFRQSTKQGTTRSSLGVQHECIGPYSALPVQESVKVMAKSLVRNRHAITKMYQLKSQLQAVSLRMAVSGCFHTFGEIVSRRTSSTGYLVLPLLHGRLPSGQRRGFVVNGMAQSAADVLLSFAP